jgi:dienelactone hydrolase
MGSQRFTWFQVLLVAITCWFTDFTSASSTYPLDYWARRAAIRNIELSPNGEYLGLLKTPAKGADPIIEIYTTADITSEPFRVNADPMEIVQFSWVDDDNLVFTARQAVRDQVDGFNRGVYEYRIALVDVARKKLETFNETDPTVVSVLPNKKDKIIISFAEGGRETLGAKVQSAFRPRAYWEFDLNRGTKKLLIRGKISLGNIDFNADGEPILARGFDIDSGEFTWYWRPNSESGWEEFYRLHEDSFEQFRVFGPDPDIPGHFIVEANNGKDTSGLWSFDAAGKSFKELLYQRNDVDICGVKYHSNTWLKSGTITGVTHCKGAPVTEYFDPQEGALHEQLQGLIPNAHYVNITSRSRDGQTVTIRNSGPRDPGTHYLLFDGTLQLIGGERPYFEAEQLSDVRYVSYEARDGERIPAYLTIPKGKPPFPMVVLPHGGPFVREVVIFDEWAQLLASAGYLVMQPQYRGSRGYGQRFYQIAFTDGGQGGYKMQDDKDDGVDWAVEKGLTKKDTVAMFGWSYGGYAALVAASRTPQSYQCVIAGAAVSDPEMQVNYYRYRLRGSSKIEQLKMWDDSVSPMNEISKINVPILMIHGSVDQRVPLDHAEKYIKALEEAGKDYQYVELDGADHFSNTLFYDHKIVLYESLLAYLQNECNLGNTVSTAAR